MAMKDFDLGPQRRIGRMESTSIKRIRDFVVGFEMHIQNEVKVKLKVDSQMLRFSCRKITSCLTIVLLQWPTFIYHFSQNLISK